MKPIKCIKCEREMKQSKGFSLRWTCKECNIYYETDTKKYLHFVLGEIKQKVEDNESP